MRFDFDELREDFGGDLLVTAETAEEIHEVVKHFGVTKDPVELARLIVAGPPYVHRAHSEKRHWYECRGALDCEFLDPYRKLLERLTGYQDQLPEGDLTDIHPRRLCHTHITHKLWLEGGHVCYVVYDNSEEWNGKAALDRAHASAEDYTAEDVGKRRHEREYINTRGGMFKKNPDYLKRHRAEPGLGAPWLWEWLWKWWREHHASEGQRQVMDAVEALNKGSCGDPEWTIRHGGGEEASLAGYHLYALDPAGDCDWDGKGTKARVYSWGEFAKL